MTSEFIELRWALTFNLCLTSCKIQIFIGANAAPLAPHIAIIHICPHLESWSLLQWLSLFYFIFFYAIWTNGWAHCEKGQMLNLVRWKPVEPQKRVLLSGRSVHTLLNKRAAPYGRREQPCCSAQASHFKAYYHSHHERLPPRLSADHRTDLLPSFSFFYFDVQKKKTRPTPNDSKHKPKMNQS